MDFQRRAGANLNTPPLSSGITAKDIEQLCLSLKSRFRKAITVIEGIDPDDRTWGNTIAEFSLALGEAAEVSALVTLPSMTHIDKATRQASSKAKDELKTMFDEAFGRQKLYDVLSSSKVLSSHSEKCEESDGSDQRLVDLMMGAFRRNGCSLEDAKKREDLFEKRRIIEETCSAFSSSLNENKDSLLFTDEELEGLVNLDQFPIEAYPNDNKRRVDLKAPFTVPILQFAKRPSTRKAVATAMAKKCQSENKNRFLETLRLRHECATLLGYESHAHFMLENKMAKSPEQVEKFLNDLVNRLKSQRDADLTTLRALKRQEESSEELHPWDISYFTRVHKATLGVDEGELQQYFPLDHVKGQILDIYEELLDLKFLKVEDAEVWHPDVECYAVMPANDSNLDNAIGYFYFDIYPREGKYSHQCVYPLRPSYNLKNGQRVKPACVNIGNLSRGTDGKPSMLRFREVETFFHEYGHVMHAVLSKSKHSLQAWAWSAVPWPGGVEQDFLEVPSMMLENFVWQPDILKRLSKRPCDGAPLPDSVIELLCKSRFAMEGLSRSRYLAMALYDLKIHSGPGPYLYKGKAFDACQLYDVMMEDIFGVSNIAETFGVASWFHPMMGYDAGYYSYIWSETFASDLFSEFENSEQETVMDSTLGAKYKKTILSPCAMLDGETMLYNFLERKATSAAFLKRITGD